MAVPEQMATLVVKVVDSKEVMQRGCPAGPQKLQMRIAECLVGDETGMIIFTARNDQGDLMKERTTVILRNAKIDMFKGWMRLAVDKWGCVEVTDPADFMVKEDNNLSLIDYELVQVVEGRFQIQVSLPSVMVVSGITKMQKDGTELSEISMWSAGHILEKH